LPSVTGILGSFGWFGPKSGGVKVENPVRLGKSVHKSIERFLYCGVVPRPEIVCERHLRAVEDFAAWWSCSGLEPVGIERQYESRLWRYTGTPDLVADEDGSLSVIDYKYSNVIRVSNVVQLAAYRELVCECLGRPVADCRLLRLRGGAFFETVFSADALSFGWRSFVHLLALYQLRKKIEVML
jgi:hypothetical protein